MLRHMPKAKGAQGQLNGKDSSGAPKEVAPEKSVKTLKELGISFNQSSRWQKLAALSNEVAEKAIAAVVELVNQTILREKASVLALRHLGDEESCTPACTVSRPLGLARLVFRRLKRLKTD
ncbi:MAG: hypothetical protein PHY16_18260 [Methylobacter sp.]|nr:hypothetical protein [Methylobacter sp.]